MLAKRDRSSAMGEFFRPAVGHLERSQGVWRMLPTCAGDGYENKCKVAESNSRVKKEEPCGSLGVDAVSDALEMHLLGLVDGLRSPLQRAIDLFWSFVPLQDAE